MLETQDAELLKKLLSYKQSQNLNDSDFSARLDIPRTTWAQHKNLKRAPGLTLLRAIVRTFPDLIPDVIEYLKGDVHAAG